MVLITLLSVGLLGLSSVSLRTGSRDDAAARARANARMSLALALGNLQRQAGLDTRVTARADILDDGNPPVLGVWKSWEGADHDNQGRPISPGNYESAKEGRFQAWMISGNQETLPDTSARKGSVALVGPETVGSGSGRSDYEIHLEPVEIDEGMNDGAIAWWIGGENQKARLPKPFRPENDSAAGWSALAKSHSIADPKMFRMESLISEPTLANKVVTHQLGDFVGEKQDLAVSKEFFHDLSTSSVGLLTNTATGGWRKDFSLLTENWSSVANSNLPFFRQKPDRDIMFTKPTGSNAYPAKSMLYPWSSYRGSNQIPIYRHGAVSSWENLKDWATAYKRITATSSGRNRIAASSFAIDGDAYNFIHKVRVLPVVARVQWVFSHYAGPPTGMTPAPPAGYVQPRLLLTPVITLWNPYSVEVQGPAVTFTLNKPIPAALRYTVNGTTGATYNSLFAGSTNNQPPMSTATQMRYQIASPGSFKPGETRIFSPGSNSYQAADAVLPLQAGYRGNKGGHYVPLVDGAGKPIAVSPGSTIKADAKFDTTYDDSVDGRISLGVGIFMDMFVNGSTSPHLAYRMTYTPQMASVVYPALPNLASGSLSTAASNPVPFMSAIFGARMASRTHIPAKGFVQSSPLVNYTAMGTKDIVEDTIRRHYLGTRHPVNSPFDYSFVEHSAGGDSYLPNASNTSQRGYIVTGFLAGDGLSRCVIADIPVRPVQSLCELQGWDMRYENPVPPFAFNLIGNSDASPLVPASAVVDPSNASLGDNLQHDDSYCANHILFDDWFVSSIAPNPTAYGTSGKSMQQNYTDFVSEGLPLGNRAYRPIAEDAFYAAGKTANATELFNDHVRSSNAWKTIASRLEVEGMFNVNSTSVVAWQALLGHARKQKVAHIQESGTAWSVDTSGDTDHNVSRFSIAGDVEAGKPGSSGAFAGASEFTGYRVLSDAQIENLAKEIVNQVRVRGPFLSLSEFINRQLSSGDLALAGAVQTALNRMAESGAGNPYSAIQSLSKDAPSLPANASEAEYRFPAAAAGESAFGLPGWIRQADLLRPIAPILSARDDTFVIRAHGDARDEDGRVLARAVCEAVVSRTRDFVDPLDNPDITTLPTSPVNKVFGRRFEITSFRWLSPSEI
ncbi:hypothetical protein OJ996_13170 [Luteolibacter sp. GHJ8]|uniref:Tfp pilus assembly protein PilX n=1 Tax=Luteolibacter rhizosphaerae TaxID=2989719 RepID=A0ABT3G3W2_9BACT|nr:hypothetical protein [Luteolibacter rhizosphaerae]MCW1914533.1 hypothetical protein [Luteolibacter rhizosphaerae]